MLAYLNDLVEFRLLPDRPSKDEISQHRDRVLAWVHLISFFASGVLVIACFYIYYSLVFALVLCNLGTVALAYTFKRYGNHIVSGNLLVILLFSVLMSEMMPTGGLYSDNLLWMLLVPITAFLFTERRCGIAWSAVVISLIVGLYFLEVTAEQSYRLATLDLSADYYLVSFLGLFGMIIGVITIFVKGNENLLDSLNKTSEKLRGRSKELETKNKLLRKQGKALKRSNHDLEFFAYVASHDLKEPLRMINTYSTLLNKSLQASMSERDQEFLQYITEGGTRMQVMLEDLLAYGKLGREAKTEEAIDLEHTILLVKKNLQLRLIESAGSIYWNRLPVLKGNSTHFIQLFQNLIANSLKFRREGVPPVIEISGVQEDETYNIRLVDNGIGIPAEDIDKIFGVFQRLGNSGKFEGSGLGLATVARIMEGLGGRIKVESEFGLGTTFILSFPISRLATAAKSSADLKERTGKGQKKNTKAAPK